MSRKKSIANYYKQQEAERKKASAQARNARFMNILIIILSIAIVFSATYLIGHALYKRAPIKVALEIKDYGTITLELYPEIAPRSVDNFVDYVEDGFYDGLKFHRVLEGFMIQGGCPNGNGTGDPSLKKIKGEFSENGFENDLLFDRGVIGMARSQDPDSATSQFFIMHKKNTNLDGKYAAFGIVLDGMEVVDAIATCDKTEDVDVNGEHYVPKTDVIITQAYIIEE